MTSRTDPTTVNTPPPPEPNHEEEEEDGATGSDDDGDAAAQPPPVSMAGMSARKRNKLVSASQAKARSRSNKLYCICQTPYDDTK